ncbi:MULTISPECIES: hypothetical protein [Flavobacterium]|uniref:hypothetical protein n=1 Tax=Flavobacterium TaxID=237 RepID=UPI001FCAD539|nr:MULTISPECIES: hypothetical protein [Flavobacterium]UOK41367.1 hypothetical protein LZF87_08545 [Flavobacterium enshiense]
MRNIKLLAVVALATLLGVISCSKEDAISSEADENSTERASENPSVAKASHNLDIIGVPQNFLGPWPDMTNKIFVPLEGRTKIQMVQADQYQILAPKDGIARFSLPDLNPSGPASYSIFAKALGGGGTVGIWTCPAVGASTVQGTDIDGYYKLCSAGSLTVDASRRARYLTVTDQFLTIKVPSNLNLDSDADIEVAAGTYPVFDDRLKDYFWKPYDGNNRLKILQLRLIEE